jgi:hypothetical protein
MAARCASRSASHLCLAKTGFLTRAEGRTQDRPRDLFFFSACFQIKKYVKISFFLFLGKIFPYLPHKQMKVLSNNWWWLNE